MHLKDFYFRVDNWPCILQAGKKSTFPISKSSFHTEYLWDFHFFRSDGSAFVTTLLQLQFHRCEMVNLPNANHVFCKTLILGKICKTVTMCLSLVHFILYI